MLLIKAVWRLREIINKLTSDAIKIGVQITHTGGPTNAPISASCDAAYDNANKRMNKKYDNTGDCLYQ